MKKLLSLVLALVLCMSAVALAETVPSKTTSDLLKVEVELENPPTDGTEVVIGSSPSEEEQKLAQDVLNGLRIYLTDKIGNIDDYFGIVIMPDGTVTTLKELLGEGDLEVNEFLPIHVENYDPAYGNATVKFTFATPYKEGEKVTILIGIVNGPDAKQDIIWYGFNAEAVEEAVIKVTFNPDILMSMQNNPSLLAVVSKVAPADEGGASFGGSNGAPAAEEGPAPAEEGPSAGSPGAPAGNEE